MLNNFRNLQSLFWSHGSRWLMFRVAYALRKRTGLIRLQMPAYAWQDRPLKTWLKKDIPAAPAAYGNWRKQNSPKFFYSPFHADEARFPDGLPWNPQIAVEEANRVCSGVIKYFSHTYHQVGYPPDWHKDPVTGIRLDSHKHWSDLSDETEADIKFIWEPSRFAMVYPLVRAYASTRDEKYAEAFWKLVQSWAASNPPNTGPNWMDGQEATLRLMAWTFGFYAFLDSPSTSPERISQFVVMVAAHAGRIYSNIAYAISTRSNHTISEAAGLWLTGVLFPELKDAGKYLSLGRELLEREVEAQIFPDGTYSMYSLNYHRFVLQVYLYVLRLAELNHSPVSNLIARQIEASVDFLAHLIEPHSGQMPVYGSNDGALVLPLNDCDFTDYRPLLQLGSYLTRKKFLFEPGPWDEDVFWLCGAQRLTPNPSLYLEKTVTNDTASFPYGGIYLLRGPNSKAILPCTEYRARPSHADQLHVDLWIRGQNIACDAGTYLYSGEGAWRNGLARTAVHNTVTVDSLDQMKMLTRFTWTDRSQGKVLHHEENIWKGEHDGYHRLPDPVSHRRTVLSLGSDRWLVVDHLVASQMHHYSLHWLLCDGDYRVQEFATGNCVLLDPSNGKPSHSKIFIQTGLLDGKGNFSVVRADPGSTRGWRSQYYGHKEPAISLMLSTAQPNACFWSYFGLDGDLIEQGDKTLKISAGELNIMIDLDPLNK